MRIVQTFWTGGQDPLKHGFGWLHAEYNLMSWALSCLSLRRHYDEVVLYTDTAGKRILIDELHLPYTDVQVVYDNTGWLPQHWAQAKIKTYSMQTRPFLHVDGDIYISRPLPKDVLSAPLIAQNREIGTAYYKKMMDRILSHPEIRLPDYVEKGLREESIASYNMGFFGGSDLDFIHLYCDETFRFMEENRMNDVSCPHSRVDCNVFFEQVMFAVLVDKNNREVASVLGKAMHDRGYNSQDFCDIQHFDRHPFHHILGGHKRNIIHNEALADALIRESPEVLLQIISLFPERHVRVAKETVLTANLKVEKCISQYEDFLRAVERKWVGLTINELFVVEQCVAESAFFADAGNELLRDARFIRNPHIECFDVPMTWPQRAKGVLNERFGRGRGTDFNYVLVIPRLRQNGLREIPVGNLEWRIVESLAGGELTFDEISKRFIATFIHRKANEEDAYRKLSSQLIKYLLKQGAILLGPDKQNNYSINQLNKKNYGSK